MIKSVIQSSIAALVLGMAVSTGAQASNHGKANPAAQAAPAGATKVCFNMGGMGNYNYAPDGRSGVAAMAGEFEGGVTFRQIGDFKDVGNGRLEGQFEHMFVTADGSTLRTRDLSWGYAVPNTDYIVGGGAYTVVDATGRFAGMRGTFNSWGTFAPKKGQAVLRYDGQICRA
jgi:hypothetical protein